METTMRHPVPICATVSRRTGEIRFQWADDQEAQLLFGRIMNRIDRRAREADGMAAGLPGRAQDPRCGSIPQAMQE